MSQTKVEQNKEMKKNRKKDVAKNKVKERLADVIWGICMCVIAGWVVFSVYGKFEARQEAKRHEISTPVAMDALNDYLATVEEGEE